MPGHKPSDAVLETIRQSFAAAPVKNPDGINGINLHSDIGQGASSAAAMKWLIAKTGMPLDVNPRISGLLLMNTNLRILLLPAWISSIT